MVAAPQLLAPIPLDDFNPFTAAYYMGAWVSVRQQTAPADTAVVWEFLKGLLVLERALEIKDYWRRNPAIMAVRTLYPELDEHMKGDKAPRVYGGYTEPMGRSKYRGWKLSQG